MAENNSKTFIIGIVVFVLLVIGGFAFFAKKDVAVDQTAMEAPVDGAPVAAEAEAPAPAPVPVPEQSTDQAAEPAAAPAVEAAPAAGEAAPATEAAPAAEQAPAAE